MSLYWLNHILNIFLRKSKQKRRLEVGRVLRRMVVVRVGIEVIFFCFVFFFFRTKFLFLIPLRSWFLDHHTPVIYRKIKTTEAECCGGYYKRERKELASFLGRRQWESVGKIRIGFSHAVVFIFKWDVKDIFTHKSVQGFFIAGPLL